MFILQFGCNAYGEFEVNPSWRNVKAFESMPQEIIKARNNDANFQDLNSLDVMVRSCVVVIKEWPELKDKYPAQTKIISNYKSFKQLLPKRFQ
jgi:hypothetical protein